MIKYSNSKRVFDLDIWDCPFEKNVVTFIKEIKMMIEICFGN